VGAARGGGTATDSADSRVALAAEDLEPDGDQADRYTVRSVAKAMRLINIVADGPPEGLTLSDLARSLGASKSTTLALARTLTTSGVLRDARPGPRYYLGTALIRLGDITRRQLPLGEICRPVLSELAEQTRMTSRVAVCDDGYPVFIERVDGPGSVRFHTPLGQREVPHTSAAGKAMLATMTEQEVRAICAATGMVRRTAHTITDVDSLLANLALARANGFAVDDEEDAEGIFCVGAVFFGHDGSCAGAVSVTGIKGDLPAWRMNELGRMVQRYASKISASLGGGRYSERYPAAAGATA
jgi:IclR family acetate operon transcriptional repressor